MIWLWWILSSSELYPQRVPCIILRDQDPFSIYMLTMAQPIRRDVLSSPLIGADVAQKSGPASMFFSLGSLLPTEFSIQLRAWITNHTRIKLWYVIAHPCPVRRWSSSMDGRLPTIENMGAMPCPCPTLSLMQLSRCAWMINYIPLTTMDVITYSCHIFVKEAPGAVSLQRCHLTGLGIAIVRIKRLHNRLIFIMKIPYLQRRSLHWNGAPVTVLMLSSPGFVPRIPPTERGRVS